MALPYRGARVCRSLVCGKPLHSLTRDLGRDRVAAVELPVAYLVPVALQWRHDLAAGSVDWEHVVARAVGDKDGRLAPAPRRGREIRRERDHVCEQVSVGQAEREGIIPSPFVLCWPWIDEDARIMANAVNLLRIRNLPACGPYQ